MSNENLEIEVRHLREAVEALKEIAEKQAGEIGRLEAEVKVLKIRHENEDKFNLEHLQKLTGKLARMEAEVKVLMEE